MFKYLRSYRSMSLFNAITQSQSRRLYFLSCGEVGSGGDVNGDHAFVSRNRNGVTKSYGFAATLFFLPEESSQAWIYP